MIEHVSIGVRNVPSTKSFYDATLGALGYSALVARDRWAGYGKERIEPAFHAAALAAGGSDNGAPGVRADYGASYYAAYVIDPDGYRLEAYCGTPAT